MPPQEFAVDPVTPAATTVPDILLLPAPSTHPHRSLLQHLSGVAALVLIFFTGAEMTVAYLSGTQPAASASQQVASAAAMVATKDAFDGISLVAKSVYVVDLTTNRVLYSQNPDVQLPLASLAKVPLVLAISEVLPPDSFINIPKHTTPDAAPIRLPAGLRFSTQDLIDFTLVASSNEGAEILSNAAAESLQVKYPRATPSTPVLSRMNAIAHDLGLSNTYFLNTNGLDLSATQAGAYGSAHDIATLFGYAVSHASARFAQTARTEVKITAETGESVTAPNTDQALSSIPAIIMGKTGYTELAGGNLAVVFEVGPSHPVVAVVLHSTQTGRFEDIKKLIAATQAAIAANAAPNL